ncbi:MAG: F0F1 ATP synthase subunit A [Chloroflexi bacterium]|nr:F0F1 ATP synthase subunit A [Chloroflexota bacterium]
MLKKPGCLVLVVVTFALIIIGLFSGALLTQFVGGKVPSFLKVSQPAIELPAEAIAHVGPISVTNTLLASVLTTIVLLLLFVLGTRKMSLVPKGLQNLVETIVELLMNFVESVAGKEHGRMFFPLVATIFIFVLTNAWLSLFPIFGPIGVKEVVEGHEKLVPLFRGANTDVNVPLTLALMSFVFVEFWGIRSVGLVPYLGKFIRISAFHPRNFKGLKSLPMTLMMGVIDLFVGAIEALSELIRLVSFTFRLFGNMTAGEILLGVSVFMIPFVVADFFYFLELLVGFIQALIFGGLTLVFATLAVAAHGKEH